MLGMSKRDVERVLDWEAGQYIRRIDDRNTQKAFKELIEAIGKAIENNNGEIERHLHSYFVER